MPIYFASVRSRPQALPSRDERMPLVAPSEFRRGQKARYALLEVVSCCEPRAFPVASIRPCDPARNGYGATPAHGLKCKLDQWANKIHANDDAGRGDQRGHIIRSVQPGRQRAAARRNGVPVEITGRAYDILVVLATNNPSKPMADPSEIAKLAVSRSSRRLDCTRFRYSAGTSWLLPSASLLTPPRRIWLDRP
jgi:hypothetical protein